MENTQKGFNCSLASFECVAMLGIFAISLALPLMGIMA